MRVSLETLVLLADLGDYSAAAVYCSCVSRKVEARTMRALPGCPIVSAVPGARRPTVQGMMPAPSAATSTRSY